MKRFILSLLLTFTSIALCNKGWAQATPSPEPDNLRAVLEVMRSDLNGYKIRTVNQAMALTAAEAEQFWPIYRQYEKELAALGDRKVALIREFADQWSSDSLDQKKYDRLAQRWLQNASDRVALWKKYQKKLSKAVSPLRAAQFLQIEHQMALLIDISVAAEMPKLGATTALAK